MLQGMQVSSERHVSMLSKAPLQPHLCARPPIDPPSPNQISRASRRSTYPFICPTPIVWMHQTSQHQERLQQLQAEKAALQKEFQSLDAQVKEDEQALGSKPKESEQVG